VIKAVKHYRIYLVNSPFTIVTDHQPLTKFFSMPNPEGRVARWAMYLSQFKCDIQYKHGLVNSDVDTLSRLPQVDSEPGTQQDTSEEDSTFIELKSIEVLNHSDQQPSVSETNDCFATIERNSRYNKKRKRTKVNIKQSLVPITELTEINFDIVKAEQQKDEHCSQVRDYWLHDKLPDDDKAARKIILENDMYSVIDNVLYHVWHRDKRLDPVLQLVIPTTLVNQILNAVHDDIISSHLGYTRTLSKLRLRYFWPGMSRDVDNWVRSCPSCSHRKSVR
jgi:hypothetical protein